MNTLLGQERLLPLLWFILLAPWLLFRKHCMPAPQSAQYMVTESGGLSLPGCAQSSPGFMPPFSFFFLCNATISLSLLNSPTEGTMLSQGSSLLVSWYVVFTAGEGQLQGLQEGGNHLLKHSIWIWRHWNQSVITVVFQAYTPMSKDSQGIPLCPVVSLSNPSWVFLADHIPSSRKMKILHGLWSPCIL